ncbi:hypothetical protein JCM3765_006287 [Sporobolomyces pararoseus]
MSTSTIELHLKEQTRAFELPSSASLTFKDFLDDAAQVFRLDPRAQGLTSFTYEDEDGDQILVSSPEEFAEFLSFVVDSTHTQPVVHLTLSSTSKDRPDDVKELLEKVKDAIKADHSIARDLREIVREVCGPKPDHHHRHSAPPHHHHRYEGGGRGRGRGGPRSRERGGPYDRGCRRGHGHGDESDGGPGDYPHEFPPFPLPHFGCHGPPPPPLPHHEGRHPFPPPPPPMWNVERTIREHWSPIPQGPPPPPPFHPGPGSHHSCHPCPPPPPPPPMCHPHPPFPPHGFEFDSFYPPPHFHSHSRRHRSDPPPPPPPPPHGRSHRHRFPEDRDDRDEGEGDDDWEFEFKKLRV